MDGYLPSTTPHILLPLFTGMTAETKYPMRRGSKTWVGCEDLLSTRRTWSPSVVPDTFPSIKIYQERGNSLTSTVGEIRENALPCVTQKIKTKPNANNGEAMKTGAISKTSLRRLFHGCSGRDDFNSSISFYWLLDTHLSMPVRLTDLWTLVNNLLTSS